MKVLVTGAAGKLGSAVCARLLASGHEVKATDRKHLRGLTTQLVIADLCDEISVYGLLEGCDAVAHLGNHSNLFAGPSVQRLVAENTAMNANVFRAAVDIGMQRIVFASSVQAMLRVQNGMRSEPPFAIPYLPLDGAAPNNPGSNFYGLSKEFGERMLAELSQSNPGLAATALRFPVLIGESWLDRFTFGGKPSPRSSFNFGELLGYLMFADAADLVRAALEYELPGYHQYYPAQTLEVRGVSAADLIREFYPSVPLRRPIEQIDTLVDLTAITVALGWRPAHRATVEFCV
jgi:nucleoside-diphosphate-sugar epimerase